ncbi:LuxR C-terminal-related transcriptional regulator [Arthrobacter agilis]|jgi:DNA-binding CsgD family transcriptional regulator|uniref:LuxR C-terminal-related transcriptional regulator n=1 Tax=Arthrobacter agilis TaxID=37921 RepID=UPI00278B4585|nr:LuxR C-terminal-related transcriptional regulator [Arthrobacter agilis]MDQ0736454.1 DNA-binding CsgD family transcriptional regulator [Arthrobacter agilis]
MLDATSLEVYRYAVGHPGWTRAEASEALGLTLRRIEAAIAELSDRRLLSAEAGKPEGLVAVSPDVALADLVDADERSLQDLKARISSRRRELSSLLPTFLEARKSVLASTSVETLEDPHLIHRVLIDYGRDVTEKVYIAQPGQGSTADVHEESVRKDLELLENGVRRRTLYDTSLRDHVPTRRAVEAIVAGGGEFGVLPFIPLRMLIFDEKLALVGRQLTRDDKAALVIRDSSLINIFTLLFDVAWEISESFLAPERVESPLSSLQRSIIQGLANGLSDESIARRLDINVRTCRRHIAWMLDTLRAESRFQAALKAREAGWV